MSVTKVTGMMSTSTKGGDIPSASTLVIDTDGNYFDITGTTGITAMTVDAGRRFTLQFDGAVVLTHGSSLYLPGAVNFTTEANDSLEFIATAANTVRCTGYALKDGGSPVAAASEGVAANGFYVRVSGAQANATGDGTIVDMSGIAHGDVIDTGSDVTNGTHTAPATGLYCYVISVNFGGMASGHNQITIDLVTSNRTRYVLETHGYNTSNSGSQGMWWATVITEMDASDTAYYKYKVNGAAKSCDLQANTSSFAGFRIE